jgi:YggT family protein
MRHTAALRLWAPGKRRGQPNSRLMATLALLADAASSLNTFIDVFIYVYVLLIFVYVLTSWVRLPYSTWVRRISDFLRDVCEPYLRICRRILPPLGPLDLSPVVAIFALFALKEVVDALFDHFS